MPRPLCSIGLLIANKLQVELVPRDEDMCEGSNLDTRNGKTKWNAFCKTEDQLSLVAIDLVIPDIIEQLAVFCCDDCKGKKKKGRLKELHKIY